MEIHSEWRFIHPLFLVGDFSILNGENASKKHIYRCFKKERFETLLKKFEWRNFHSEWRFFHSEWRKCCGKKRETNFKKSSKRFFKKV
jgi:hypothetical protein